jgi:hypothetical protein
MPSDDTIEYKTKQLYLFAPDLIAIVRQKLAVPGNESLQLTRERRAEMERQIHTDLKPVLRSRDFERFNLDRIWAALVVLIDHLKKV